MATNTSKKVAGKRNVRPRAAKAEPTTSRSIRTVKTPPKSGSLSRVAVRNAVAGAVLAHKK